MRILRKLNDFFFVVEPDEPADVTSAALFYGVLAVAIIVSVVCLIAGLTA